jgi:hypothetical protein
MRAAVVPLLVVSAAVAAACHSGARSTAPAPSTGVSPKPDAPPSAAGGVAQGQGAPGMSGMPGGPGGARRPRPSPAAMDSMRRGMVARMLTEIAGRENEPAEQVFKNVKLWKGLPARALLDTMNSYGRALGTTCTGCHVADQWASDNRKNKGIARQMQLMVNDLNTSYLTKVPELDEDHPPVTCAMCHMGSGHPRKDVDLGAPAPAPAPSSRTP